MKRGGDLPLLTQYNRNQEVLYPSKFYGLEYLEEENVLRSINNIYLNGVRIAALNEEGTTAYFLTDQVDSVAHVLDENGHTLSRMQYEPYGETLVQRGNLNFAPKYNSQELDRETNFYFYNARYYDPQIARFTSADTVVPETGLVSQSWNRFSYVAGNPIRYKDPTGHEEKTFGDSVKGFFKGAATRYGQDLAASTFPGIVKSNIDFARSLPGLANKAAGFGKQFYSAYKSNKVGEFLNNKANNAWNSTKAAGFKALDHVVKNPGETLGHLTVGAAEGGAGIAKAGGNWKNFAKLFGKPNSSTIADISNEAFIHITTPKDALKILKLGLDPNRSGYVTKWKYIKDVQSPSEFNTKLYRKDLWPGKAGKFDDGATFLQIDSKPKFFSPRTNWIDGVPQYINEDLVPATKIKLVGGL
ncbi:RHS repeat domain-containing protein [Leptospira wolffii]|uniref:RHS repeat domain-containing protein n=1 Tax=Leptospira wolffii TaxID=409998 RepID=UPI000353C1F0|nr:RHS repeat-associated core domain-containing protein [Leptospira wolffii]EPG66198.1 RHS repeat-associated core domain protein [Leptospira wolffii serovar Khorat str. Khorat-H2]